MIPPTVAQRRSRPCCVYAYLDECGEVVYVGSTYRLDERHKDHVRGSAWLRPTMTLHILTARETRGDAFTAEAWYIKMLRPRFNVVHNRPRRSERAA